jgi:hypothetical protein
MIEAGGPSTSEFQEGPIRIVVPVPPTVVMVSPPEAPRNASRAQSEGPHQVRRGPSAAFGQYRGWDHTPSFAAAKLGSLILREDCHNVVTRAPSVGNDSLLYPTASERGEGMLSLCSSGYSQRWRW